MKIRILALAVVFITSIWATTTVLAFSKKPAPMTPKQAAEASNQFAADLYTVLGDNENNLFFSPVSLTLALSMAWTGANGETAQAMAKTLHFPNNSPDVGSAFGQLQQTLDSGDALYTFKIANRLWGQKDFQFKQDFLSTLDKHYRADLKQVDFRKETEKTRQQINHWVANQTAEKIKNLIPKGMLDASSRLVLTNAVYFLGEWQSKFEGSDTFDRRFYLLDGNSITVKTMNQKNIFMYAETETDQILRLPYQGNELEMMILLPKDKTQKMSTELPIPTDNLFTEKRINCWLPRFSIQDEFTLKKVLSQLGMGPAFGSNANFSGMSNSGELNISEVVHKSFIDVYEKGTEAAAATGIVMRTTSVGRIDPEMINFIADHPFVFVIRHIKTQSILFLGRICNPE